MESGQKGVDYRDLKSHSLGVSGNDAHIPLICTSITALSQISESGEKGWSQTQRGGVSRERGRGRQDEARERKGGVREKRRDGASQRDGVSQVSGEEVMKLRKQQWYRHILQKLALDLSRLSPYHTCTHSQVGASPGNPTPTTRTHPWQQTAILSQHPEVVSTSSHPLVSVWEGERDSSL